MSLRRGVVVFVFFGFLVWGLVSYFVFGKLDIILECKRVFLFVYLGGIL